MLNLSVWGAGGFSSHTNLYFSPSSYKWLTLSFLQRFISCGVSLGHSTSTFFSFFYDGYNGSSVYLGFLSIRRDAGSLTFKSLVLPTLTFLHKISYLSSWIRLTFFSWISYARSFVSSLLASESAPWNLAKMLNLSIYGPDGFSSQTKLYIKPLS